MSEREKSAPSVQRASSHLALYRKYRSRTLDEIIGQPQVTDVLKAAAATKNFAHAYLLTGQRGTGKTSVARILAHLINETPYDTDEKDADLDIIEIDAASRGSVDDARELREKSAIAPIRAQHKIYIIDEVHMLSTAAFNALLKIIEEPPEHIVFILATTELQKVPATILSRVQRFHFRPVPAEIVSKHLRQISDTEKITIDDEALLLIAQRGGGSLRDAISLLDQLSGTAGPITRQTVEEILGLAPETEINKIIDNLKSDSSENSIEIVTTLQKLFADGISSSLIVNQLIDVLENLAPANPELYELIEKLLDVAKSAAPDVKLTAILMQFATRSTCHSGLDPESSDKKSVSQNERNSKVVAQVATATREEEKLADIIEKNIAEEDQYCHPELTLSSRAKPRDLVSGSSEPPRILVFLHGTTIMHATTKGKSREEIIQQVQNQEDSVRDFASYIPIGNAAEKLQKWTDQGAEISYLSALTENKKGRGDEVVSLEDLKWDQKILDKYNFPKGKIYHRAKDETYAQIAEKIQPDILIEDDCESIGGEKEMTIAFVSPEIKKKIKSIPIKEFGGIDYLPDDLGELVNASRDNDWIPGQARNDNASLDNNSQVQEETPTYNKNLPKEISWPNILDQIQKSDQPAILATANFAEHVYENGQITLYFTKAFHRKKAETAKFRNAVAEAIKSLYDCNIEIIIATMTVPENSDAAKILDIMGGGEVISSLRVSDGGENHGKA